MKLIIVLLVLCCLTGVARAEVEITEELIQSIIKIESNGNPNAVGKAGEIGLMQISPIVRKEFIEYIAEYNQCSYEYALGYVTPNDLRKPFANKMVGVWYLEKLRDHYIPKDKLTLEVLLGSWNWGPTAVRKVNYDYDRFPLQVKDYIRKVKKEMK